MDKPLAIFDQVQSVIVTQAVSFGPKLIVAMIILIVGFYAGGWAGKVVRRSLQHLQLEPDLLQLIVRTIRVLVLALFALLALQNLGVQLLPLIAGLGVAGAGVALAMQGLLSNLVAGLVIIFTHPFRIGEYVSMIGVEGQVESISIFNTVLLHTDSSRVVVPNRKIIGKILHNYGHIRQLDLRVQVAYDSDLNKVQTVVRGVLNTNPRVLAEPAALVQIVSLEESGVVIGIKPWVAVPDNPAAVGEINQAVLEAFRLHAVSVPYPQREIRLLGQS